jgi:type II secretory ATPase GspE/PulE/Tfp pilus assembly ATPase PilB-like protein
MPVSIDGNKLTIAVAEPLDIYSQDDMRAHLGLEPKFVLASAWDIDEALKKYYGFASETIDRIMTKEPKRFRKEQGADDGAVEDIERQTEDPTVTKLVNQIILEAYQKRATDIHIEPYRHKVRFRYRIDGALIDANLPSEARHFLAAIISRIKIMAELSITEKRKPLDGSAVVRVGEQALDLRVSTIPTLHGESMVIRLLPTSSELLNLEKLGFNEDNARCFRDLVRRPHGVIFVTGPTGSGKTTTLYACLNEINDADRKIITIEDPVEYEMDGITQIQINTEVNFSFAQGLRSILRHDPDILMVGEVRDTETANIAIRTALTGHLVFSSLHTNDAASAVTRLVDMGVEPYLVASSVQAFVAQRLVRMICPKCKEEDFTPLTEIREEIADSLGGFEASEIKIFKGKGCDHCNNTGYYGRTAIYEILELDEHIRGVILDKPRAEEIKRIALAHGMKTLRQDGWKNVAAGVTTPAEVMNVTMKEV